MLARFARAATLALTVAFLATPAFAQDAPDIKPDAVNPPPSVALKTYQRFEAVPVAMGAPFAGQKSNEIAKERLQANLDERLDPVLAQWNARHAGDKPRTLRIQPEIRYIRFITGGKRFLGGAFAGGSSILVTVKFTDASTGVVIAQPDFYQHANAMGAAWSFGATDKTMLTRVATMISEYLKTNYDKPVGGPISQAPERVADPE